jgi:drug/metabolite transporter (DMT)-like permease
MTPHQLTLSVTLLVLLAGVIHASWNAIASRIDDRVLAGGLIGVTQAAVSALALPLAGFPRSAALPFAAGSATVHIAYTYALVYSYRLGGFGRSYPLARGTAPLLVAVGGWFLAGEHLDALQLAGTCTIAASLLAIVFVGGRPRRADGPGLAMALGTGVTIAAYTVLDGLGARHAHDPVGYLAVMMAMQGPCVGAISAAILWHRPRPISASDIRAGLLAGTLGTVAYGIVIWAQTRGPLALVSALRETSVISAALISALVFREPLGRRRIGPAIAVVAGIILVSV